MSQRHVQLLHFIMDEEEVHLADLQKRPVHFCPMKNTYKTLVRDLIYLIGLNAIAVWRLPEDQGFLISIQLE